MKFIFSYLMPLKKKLLLEIPLKIVGTITDLFLPLILAYILNTAIKDAIKKDSITPVLIWGGLMIICAFAGLIFNILANRITASISREATKKIRHDLFTKIFTLSQSQIDKLGTPSLIYRISNDTYNIHHMITMSLRLAIRAPILLIGGILLTLTLDFVLALVLIAILPIIAVIIIYITKKAIPRYDALQKSSDQLVTTVRENITGIRVIKALSTEEYEMDRFEDINKKTVKKELKANITMASINPIMSLLLNIGFVFIVLLGAYRVQSGAIEPGTIVAFLQYFIIILHATLALNRVFMGISRASASASRIKNIINMQSELLIEKTAPINSTYHIEFKNVSFSYLKVKNDIENINIKLKRGEKLGILGPTGSGKTTLINLLMRFYDADKGNIYIDGEDIRGINNKILKDKFGVVFQNDILFSESIYENIDFGRGIKYQNIISSSKKAQIAKHIEQMQYEYDTVLSSKGINLSGGQKQRLMISRALVNNPEILILDDASSALDYKTDAKLRKAIKNDNQTQIIITQRISSIKNCDKIIIIENGKIVDYGNHNTLLEKSKTYQNITSMQMEVVK